MQKDQLGFFFENIEKSRHLVESIKSAMQITNPATGVVVLGGAKMGKTTILREVEMFCHNNGNPVMLFSGALGIPPEQLQSFLLEAPMASKTLIIDDADKLPKSADIEHLVKDFLDQETSLKNFLIITAEKEFLFNLTDLNSRISLMSREHLSCF